MVFHVPAVHHSPSTDASLSSSSKWCIERFHRRLKDALRARGASADWYNHLPWVLLAIRTASRDEESPSPAELLYGAQLVVPGQFIAASEDPPPADSFLQQLRSFVDASAPPPILHNRPSTATARDSIPTALLHARHLFVRRDSAKPPLAPAYDGPYLVLESSPHTFRLQLGDKTDVVATACLKAAILPPDAAAAEPRRRGRPARGPALLPAAPSVPARSAIRRALLDPPKRVTFATTVDVAPDGRPQRLRRPPDRFSVSSLDSETGGEV
jgi:hypothetical protein